jgi:hypothetical protein
MTPLWRICHGCVGKIPRGELLWPERVDSSQRQTLALSPLSNSHGGFLMQPMNFVVAAMALLVLVSVMGGTIVVVAGVTPMVINAAAN